MLKKTSLQIQVITFVELIPQLGIPILGFEYVGEVKFLIKSL